MNPIAYLKGFAWLSIVALSCSIFSNFWLPMLLGAIVLTLFVKILT
jgi:ABC-type transport system involved in multi-copper enzyme maturation permease subunit